MGKKNLIHSFTIMLIFLTLCMASDAQSPYIDDFAWNADGSLFATVYIDGRITITDTQKNEMLQEFSVENFSPSISWHPLDTQILAFSSYNSPIIIADAHTAETIHQIDGAFNTYNISFSPDGEKILSTHGGSFPTSDGILQIWDMATGENIGKSEIHGTIIRSGIWSPDGNYIASTSDAYGNRDDSYPIIWDANTLEPVSALTDATDYTSNTNFVFWHPEKDYVLSVDFSYLDIWDATTFTHLESSLFFGNYDAEFNKSGTILALASDFKIVFLDAGTFEIIQEVEFDIELKRAIAWHSQQDTLAYTDGETIFYLDFMSN